MRKAEEELWAGGKRHRWGEKEGVFRGGGVSGEKQLKTVRTDAGESTVRAERAEPQENQIRQNTGAVRLSICFEETFNHGCGCSHYFMKQRGKISVCSGSVMGSHRTHLAGRQDKMGVLMGSPQILM